MNHVTYDNKIEPDEVMDTREDSNTNTGIADIDDGDKMVNGDNAGCETIPVDEGMDADDDARSEATFQFKIENFSKMKDSVLSSPTYVRNLPWKIMAMPRLNQATTHDRQPNKSLGFFLQCNGESDASTWSCNANAELRLLSQKEGVEHIKRKINHVFYSKENDWGFSHFHTWGDILDAEKGYIKDDTVILEVHVTADAPHGVSWDSKKHTGYVGLKNQGATCYMNSLLQTLYFTHRLRKAVYQMPTESDDSTKSVALALQRVFYDLQFSDRPVGTKKLTKSFGWETLDSFMQHDVQELCRVLLDNMESKMKGTCVEGTIPALFEGKMISFIRCKNVDYQSKRVEPFYDIQLNVKGKRNIYESFKDYTAVETLDGDNKYDAGDFGLQEAEKGIIFQSFPPVLHLHLLRFQYDPLTDTNIKINDRFEFFESLDLSEFIQKPQPPDAPSPKYTLHAVLVHSGDNHGGHYVVFINPKADGRWCKFDDDVVSRCSKQEGIDQNFGGNDDDVSVKHCTNAYMLVYIRDDAIDSVSESDIPEQLCERLHEEKRQEAIRRKDRNEAHLYMNISIYTEENFMGHRGIDLFDPEKTKSITLRVRKNASIKETLETIACQMKYPLDGIRLWPITARTNETSRPTNLEPEELNKPVGDLAENSGGTWNIFLELISPDSPSKSLPPIDRATDVLLFFKLYDPRYQMLSYFCHMHRPMNSTARDLIPLLNEKAGFPRDTPLDLYEEVNKDNLEKIESVKFDLPLNKVLDELMDGDIIVFQRADLGNDFPLPTASCYYKDLQYRVEVTFCDRTVNNDPGFMMELNYRMNYDQIATAVSQRLGVDSCLIQFFKPGGYRDTPQTMPPIKYNYDGTLKEMLASCKSRPKKLFYQVLSISINELENKKQFKCIFVNAKLKEEKELLLYPNKSGTVGDLLEEAKKVISQSPDSSGKLRLLEISSNKISQIFTEDALLECINVGTVSNKVYRIEEVPKEEATLAPGEILVPVAHFHKEQFSTFGTPFLFRIKQKEPLAQFRERIQKKLELPEKEFEKYKLAVVLGNRVQYLTEESNEFISSQDFPTTTGLAGPSKPWLGLEHVNKASKRPRYNYLEKAIKIHN